MHADSVKLLWDARSAADRVARFVSGKSFEDYRSDEMLRSAVERQLEIVGEALGRLRRIDGETAASLPEIGRVIAFRNVLVHGYATIDDKIVWGVLEADLDNLRTRLQSLIDSA
ncbi:MAG: DUF86 domain-containing protein [Hyphomicrobiaceae bacterium]|nr:DUF86 domain-containing protein [Hyphomicrobiaceae bacterium]